MKTPCSSIQNSNKQIAQEKENTLQVKNYIEPNFFFEEGQLTPDQVKKNFNYGSCKPYQAYGEFEIYSYSKNAQKNDFLNQSCVENSDDLDD